MEPGQLEGVLVGLSATVDEEELVVVVARHAAQPVGDLLLQAIDDTVGIEAQVAELALQHLHIMGMAVAYADDGMATIEVEVLLIVVVPNSRSFSLHDVDVEEGIYIE